MEQRRHQNLFVFNFTNSCQMFRDLEWMIDVGRFLGVLPSLVGMLPSGKMGGFE